MVSGACMQSALGQDAPVLSRSCLGNMSHNGSGGGQGSLGRGSWGVPHCHLERETALVQFCGRRQNVLF